MTRPLLAIFPHPDDETFTAAGLLAATAERGIPVTLVCATRGEAGESSLPELDDPDRLGAVREEELRDAMAHLGVRDVRFLDYRDSGMEGSVEAQHPRALVQAPEETVAAELAGLIREIAPGIVLTYGPEGIYGHPDHLHLHKAALRAVHLAADPAFAGQQSREPWQTPDLYFGTAPREEMVAIFDRPNSPLSSISETALANLGTPRAGITHEIDVRRWLAAKRAAVAAHVTQTGEGGPLSGMPAEAMESRLLREHYVRARLPWNTPDDPPTLLDQLAAESLPS